MPYRHIIVRLAAEAVDAQLIAALSPNAVIAAKFTASAKEKILARARLQSLQMRHD